jgi:Na+/citrate or Na+/malate symporter
MNETGGPGRILRSVGAVLAGIIVGVVLTLATDLVLHATHVFPPLGQPSSSGPLLLATIYRTIYGVAASYITARLAPDRPMGHALAGGLVGLIVSTIGAVATWNRGPAFGPHWYPVALIVLALPTAWVGGWLRVRQVGARVSG